MLPLFLVSAAVSVLKTVCAHQSVRGKYNGNVQSGTCIGHVMQYVPLACPVDALALHSGDTHPCCNKAQRGSGVNCMQRVDTRSAMQGSDPFLPARSDCWGCALRHSAATVRPQEELQAVQLHRCGEELVDDRRVPRGCKECGGQHVNGHKGGLKFVAHLQDCALILACL